VQSIRVVGEDDPGDFSGAYLWEALLLQISDDALAQQIRRANEIQDFVVVVTDEREFESIFGGINGDGTRPGRTIQAVHGLALDASQIHRVVEGANDPVITVLAR
jgi:hypothetical protein